MSVFLTLGVIGVVIVVAALLVGDVLDGIFDVDFLDNDLFSTASIGAFIGALGFGGVISLSLLPNMWVATVAGLLAGALAAWGATSLTRWLKRGESGAFQSKSLVGAAGRVITDVPAGGYGEVRVIAAGHTHKLSARSSQELAAGTEIWVSDVLSPTAVEVEAVRAVDPPDNA